MGINYEIITLNPENITSSSAIFKCELSMEPITEGFHQETLSVSGTTTIDFIEILKTYSEPAEETLTVSGTATVEFLPVE